MSTMKNEAALKKEVVKYSALLYDRGLTSSTAGNISARTPRAKYSWITPEAALKRS